MENLKSSVNPIDKSEKMKAKEQLKELVREIISEIVTENHKFKVHRK